MWLSAARRFLHGVAELPGQREIAVSRHQRRFNEQHVAADLGHATPVATPGREVRNAAPSRASAAEIRFDFADVDDCGVVGIGRDPRRDARRWFQSGVRAYGRRPRALFDDDPPQRIVGYLELRASARSPRAAAAAGRARDLDLLLLGVAAERDELHADRERRVDGAELVGRDEQHAREIDRDLHVVIGRRGSAPGPALRAALPPDRLEYRPRPCRSRRASARDWRADGLQRLHQTAGHRPDVGAAVAADLRLVANRRARCARTSGSWLSPIVGEPTSCRRPADRRAQNRSFHAGDPDGPAVRLCTSTKSDAASAPGESSTIVP